MLNYIDVYRSMLFRIWKRCCLKAVRLYRYWGTQPVEATLLEQICVQLGVDSVDPNFTLRTRNVAAVTLLNECSLHVVPYERFGNNILQIGKATIIAKMLGIKDVYLFDSDILKIPQNICLHGVRIHSEQYLPKKTPVLIDSFFYAPDLPVGRAWVEFAQTLIGPLLSIKPTCCSPADIGVHIRSGDIFSKNPHPDYFQPPLAYYLKAIRIHRTRFPGATVHVVYEDMQNPVIKEIVDYCKDKHIDYKTQSATLRDDLELLLSLKHLVFSRGTFGFSLSSIHPGLETAYTFDAWLPEIMGTVIHIKDMMDKYVPAVYPWKNSEDQREVMLNYPEENLLVLKK